MSNNDNNLIWIDLEMTGLNPDKDRIIEIATIVTNPQLDILAEGPVFAIKQSQKLIAGMDKWNTKHHGQSGLIDRVKDSDTDEAAAEQSTLAFLKRYSNPQASPMCGNTICQDRRFLYRYMPKLEQFFHYRHLDVSTLKILAQRWAPEIAAGFEKESEHLAMQDIRDSITEMRYYRKHIMTI